ncbi:unnamed protein product [Discosporangium mesarthrocarpum]
MVGAACFHPSSGAPWDAQGGVDAAGIGYGEGEAYGRWGRFACELPAPRGTEAPLPNVPNASAPPPKPPGIPPGGRGREGGPVPKVFEGSQGLAGVGEGGADSAAMMGRDRIKVLTQGFHGSLVEAQMNAAREWQQVFAALEPTQCHVEATLPSAEGNTTRTGEGEKEAASSGRINNAGMQSSKGMASAPGGKGGGAPEAHSATGTSPSLNGGARPEPPPYTHHGSSPPLTPDTVGGWSALVAGSIESDVGASMLTSQAMFRRQLWALRETLQRASGLRLVGLACLPLLLVRPAHLVLLRHCCFLLVDHSSSSVQKQLENTVLATTTLPWLAQRSILIITGALQEPLRRRSWL